MIEAELTDTAAFMAIHATDVARNSPDHGPRHWRDVARVGLVIAERVGLTPEQRGAVFVFACTHDTQRLNEFVDPEHGARASGLFLTLLEHGGCPEWLKAFDTDLDYALMFHDRGQMEHDHEFIGSCWDADRLTIGRVGITPDVRYMSTRNVREDFQIFLSMAEDIRHGEDQTWDEIAASYCAV